jgi:hypothetical protein
LVNTTRKANTFCPIDQCQEHNIKDIKVTYCSEGPNIIWEYLKKLHPAIHLIRAVANHIEQEFGTYTRGKRHTIPSKDRDIKVKVLQESYHRAEYNKLSSGQKIGDKKDRAEDFMKNGFIKLHKGDLLAQWVDQWSFEHSTEQKWDSETSVSYDDGQEVRGDNEDGGRI